jgi:sodium-dependent dicarboxylate transporter 2/3/5
VAFSANIGGMATPIGSPPNAVAISFLRKGGHALNFLEWVLLATPLMVAMLLMMWVLLSLLFPPGVRRIEPVTGTRRLTRRSVYVMLVFAVTVTLWLGEPWHGLPATVVALLPMIALTASGTLGSGDVDQLDWNILILIAGGVALGAGMQVTRLDRAMADVLLSGQTTLTTLATLSLVGTTLLLSIFISNTAAANLILPVGISFATAAGGTGSAVVGVGISIALTASVAMVLPISTPPNAIVYARGEIRTRDIALAGGIIGLIAASLIALTIGWVLRFWGIGS